MCRIFSQAYHPRDGEETDPRYLHDLTLAENIIELAHYIHHQGLHGCIEVPNGANRFWKLERVIELKRLPGWFVIDVDGCMYGMLHPETSLHTKKSWRFLTNAWLFVPIGIFFLISLDPKLELESILVLARHGGSFVAW